MPQANSITSMPRETSPCASLNTLPCSAVMIAANSSRRWFISSRKRSMTRARRIGGVLLQPAKACLAEATAASTSRVSPRRSVRAMSPVAGL